MILIYKPYILTVKVGPIVVRRRIQIQKGPLSATQLELIKVENLALAFKPDISPLDIQFAKAMA